VTEFKYGAELGGAFRGKNPIKYLQNFGMSKMNSKFPMSLEILIFIFTRDKEIRTAKHSYNYIDFSKKNTGYSPHFNCFETFAYFGNIL
jgi:hypothetical protein